MLCITCKMRLLSFSHEADPPSVPSCNGDGDDRVVDLGGRLDGVSDLRTCCPGRLDDARAAVAARRARRCALADITFQPHDPRPGKIFCIGVNYGGRNAEYRDGQEAADEARACSSASRVRSSATTRTSSGHRRATSSTTRARSWPSSARPAGASPRPRPPAHRRPHARQRGHDPRLGAARQVQRHPGQELGVVRLARPVDGDARRDRRRSTISTSPPA